MSGTCWWCDEPTHRLCDYLLCGTSTCDAEMCKNHTKQIGAIRVCFSRRRGSSDTIDHCPFHATMRQVPMPEESEQYQRDAVSNHALTAKMRQGEK